MKVGEQWVSVVINSLVFQAELRERLREEEEAVVKRLAQRETNRLNALARVMRGDTQGATSFAEPAIWDRPPAKERKSTGTPEGIGEKIIKALSHMDKPERQTPAQSAQPAPVQAPLAKIVEADNAPKRVGAAQHSMACPTEVQHMPTLSERVQGARFYSRVLGEWVWIMFDYPGERSGFDQANQRLRLTNGSGWRIFPRSTPPRDGIYTVSLLRAFTPSR